MRNFISSIESSSIFKISIAVRHDYDEIHISFKTNIDELDLYRIVVSFLRITSIPITNITYIAQSSSYRYIELPIKIFEDYLRFEGWLASQFIQSTQGVSSAFDSDQISEKASLIIKLRGRLNNKIEVEIIPRSTIQRNIIIDLKKRWNRL